MPTTKKTINPDLEKERRKCTFDVEELARYWIGDQSKLEEKRARGKSLVNFLSFNSILCGFFLLLYTYTSMRYYILSVKSVTKFFMVLSAFSFLP